MSAQKLTTISDGDIQLWVLSEHGWDIPLNVEPVYYVELLPEKFYAVRPSLIMDEEPTVLVNGILSSHRRNQSGSFHLIERERFATVAKKADGITARYWFKKDGLPVRGQRPGERIRDILLQPSGKQEPKPKDIAAYLEKHSGLFDKQTAQAVLDALADLAPDWMLEELRPLDLGFVKLHALPYRNTWPQFISEQHPEIKTALKDEAWREASGLNTATIFSSKLIAMDGFSQTVKWVIEPEETDEWSARVKARESSVLSTGGSVRYADRWCKTVDHLRETIFLLLKAWLDKASSFGAVVRSCRAGGGQRLVANRKTWRILPGQLKNADKHQRGNLALVEKSSAVVALRPALENVREVSDAGPKTVDVRSTGEHNEG